MTSPASPREPLPEEAVVWGVEVARTLTGRNALALYLSIIAGVVGIFLSMLDADGESPWVFMLFLAPTLYASWLMIDVAIDSSAVSSDIFRRLSVAAMFSTWLVTVVIGVIQAIIVAFPGMRAFIAQVTDDNHGNHYWWSEGIGSQLILVPLVSGVVAMLATLAVAIVLVPLIRVFLTSHRAARGR